MSSANNDSFRSDPAVKFFENVPEYNQIIEVPKKYFDEDEWRDCYKVNLLEYFNAKQGGYYCWTPDTYLEKAVKDNPTTPIDDIRMKVKIGESGQLCKRMVQYNATAFEGVDILVVMSVNLANPPDDKKRKEIEKEIFKRLIAIGAQKYRGLARIIAGENFIVSINEVKKVFNDVYRQYPGLFNPPERTQKNFIIEKLEYNMKIEYEGSLGALKGKIENGQLTGRVVNYKEQRNFMKQLKQYYSTNPHKLTSLNGWLMELYVDEDKNPIRYKVITDREAAIGRADWKIEQLEEKEKFLQTEPRKTPPSFYPLTRT